MAGNGSPYLEAMTVDALLTIREARRSGVVTGQDVQCRPG